MPTTKRTTKPRDVTRALTEVSIIEGEFDRIGAEKISGHGWMAVATLKRILRDIDARETRKDPSLRRRPSKRAKGGKR